MSGAAARMVRGALAAALALLGAAACSKPAPPAPVSPLDEVISSHLAARGGEAKLKALRAIRETGVVTASDGRVAKVVREMQRPDLYRLEFSYQGTKSVFAHDSAGGWQVAPLQGEFEPRKVPPEIDAAGGVDQRDLEGPLVDWRTKGHQVELAGREKLAGGEAFKLKTTLKGGAIRFDYVDVASHQIVRTEATRVLGGRPAIMTSDFSDFREAGGIVFPHKIESHAQGRPRTLTIVIEKIELDPAIDVARFRFPE
jgi:hypothetical protein